MKQILFILCLVLAFRGCTNGNDDDQTAPRDDTFSFANGTDGKLSLRPGDYELIRLNNEYPKDCNFSTSDYTVASIEHLDDGYYIYAKKEGVATITACKNYNNYRIAMLKVQVTPYYKDMRFSEVYCMSTYDERDNLRYVVYRVRRYRGDDLPAGGDARLTKVDAHTADTASAESLQAIVDNFVEGNWYYLYSNGEGDEFGMFRDSCKSIRCWLVTENSLYNNGSLYVPGEGGAMQYRDFFTYDSAYSYCLGDRLFVDDVTTVNDDGSPVARQYYKSGEGNGKMPYPGYVQGGHFDKAKYTEYYEKYLESAARPSEAEYGFLREDDARMLYLYTKYAVEEGEYAYAYNTLMGCPLVAPGGSVCSFYLASGGGNGWLTSTYYNFKADMFKLYLSDGFMTDEKGEFVVPLQFGGTERVNYKNGSYPYSNKIRRDTREMPIRTSALSKQLSVNNTIGATIRMTLAYGK